MGKKIRLEQIKCKRPCYCQQCILYLESFALKKWNLKLNLRKEKYKQNKENKLNVRIKFNTFEEIYNYFVIKNENGCWDWKGIKHNFGYGRAALNKKQIGAHRLSWIIHKGEIPKGMHILHKCDNPPCSNPDHLYVGTNIENARDRKERAKYRKKCTCKNESSNNSTHNMDISS